MNRVVLIVEWEDNPKCYRKDVEEAIEHLRRDHGATVLEESVGGLFEKAAEAMVKLLRIEKALGLK